MPQNAWAAAFEPPIKESIRSAKGLAANATDISSSVQASLFTSFDYTASMRLRLGILLVAGLLHADTGLAPRPKPEDFPECKDASRVAIGAEFMIHSFGRDAERYVNEDYLTVEVGVYPTNRTPVVVALGQFTLRINGKKDAIAAATPSLVAASLKYPDWEQHAQLEAGAGPVTIGRPQQTSRFPGDNRPAQQRGPAPPKAPTDSATQVPEHIAPSELVKEVAIEEGEHKFPTGGYLYFPYHGKIKSIKTLDLIYDNGSESVTLRLR